MKATVSALTVSLNLSPAINLADVERDQRTEPPGASFVTYRW